MTRTRSFLSMSAQHTLISLSAAAAALRGLHGDTHVMMSRSSKILE